MAFLHAGGTVIEKELEGETLRVDTGCIVAFSPGIEYDIQRAGGLKSGNNAEAGRIAHIVRIGLEGQTEDGNGLVL